MRNFKKRPHRVFIDKNKSPYFNINGKKVKILTKYNQGQLANKIINNYYQEKKKRRNNKKQAKKSASSYNSGIFSQQVKQNIIALENDNKLKLLELKDKELANTEKQLLLADVKKNAVAANMLLTEPGAAEDDALITMTKKEFERLARIVKNNKEAEKKKIVNEKEAEKNQIIKDKEAEKEQIIKVKDKEKRRGEKEIAFENNFNKNNDTTFFNQLAKDLDLMPIIKSGPNKGKKADILRNSSGHPMKDYEQKKYLEEKIDKRSLNKFFQDPDYKKTPVKSAFVETIKKGEIFRPKKEKNEDILNTSTNLFPEYQNPPINPNIIEEQDDEQQANGLHDGKNGLYNTDIEEIIKLVGKDNKRLKQSWKGVYSIDEIDDLTKAIKKDDRYISFILNLDPSDQPGSHWVACWIDVYKRREICYYDSFGHIYPPRFLKDISLVIDKLKPTYYLMLKYNKIKYQSVSSSNCGWFAVKFLFDMANKAEFKDCTGYTTMVEKSENQIENFQKKIINKLI